MLYLFFELIKSGLFADGDILMMIDGRKLFTMLMIQSGPLSKHECIFGGIILFRCDVSGVVIFSIP